MSWPPQLSRAPLRDLGEVGPGDLARADGEDVLLLPAGAVPLAALIMAYFSLLWQSNLFSHHELRGGAPTP